MTRGFGKCLNVWMTRFFAVSIAMGMMLGLATADTSVVLQGYQIQSEKYAANTADAYVKALKTQPGSDVIAFRPQTQPGWEGGESYSNKSALLSQLKSLATGKDDLVLVLVGDGDGPGNTFRVSEEEGITATELAEAVSGAARVGLVSAGCNSLAIVAAAKLPEDKVSVAVSGVGAGAVAHTWPLGNRGQYDLFSRYLIEGLYLQATNAATGGQTSDLIARSYSSAHRRMIQTSGGSQAASSFADYGAPAGPAGQVVSVGNREYLFNVQDLGNGSLAGFVSNSLGLPIAPVTSARITDGRVSFSFDERGRERAVTIADVEGVPAVTVDTRPSRFSYRPIRIDLVSGIKHVGVAYVTPRLAKSPTAITYLMNGKSAAKVVYEPGSHALSMALPQDGGSLDATITFGSLGGVEVRVGQSTYNASQVVRYGLYGDAGDRLATAVAVLSDGELKGEVLPTTSEMRLPIDARITNGEITGSASLVGNTFTFLAGSIWESNRPPAKGIIQSDFFSLPLISEAYADGSAGDGRVEITWNVDSATMSDAVLGGDLRFQVVRTDRFNNKAEAFDVPAGRRQYTDRLSGDVKSFDYSVRALLDHRVTTCVPGESFPIVGDAVAALTGRQAPKAAQSPVAVVAASASSERLMSEKTPEVAAPGVSPDEPVVVAADPPEMAAEEGEPKQEAKPDQEEEPEEEEETGLDRIRKKQEGEGRGGKVIYGLLGLLIAIGLAIAVGGGSGPSDLEPG